MAWTRPSLPELTSRIENDLNVRFFTTTGPLRRSALKILARVVAGGVYVVLLFVSWIYDQAFAHLADGDQLDRHGQEVGVFRKPAAYAKGFVNITGVAGTNIPQGTLFSAVTVDNGVATTWEYETTEFATVEVGGTVSVGVSAVQPGVGGNQPVGTVLEIVTPLADIEPTCAVTVALADGADKEADEPYRRRVLFRKHNPPQGGADADYVIWATTVSGVSDAWAFPNYPEANSVSVRIANFQADPPVCSPAVVANTLAYLTDRTRRPVTADVRVQSVAMVDITVSAQIRPNTASSRASVIAEIEAALSAEGRAKGDPGAPGTTISLSRLQSAMASASGVDAAEIVQVTQAGSPVSEIALNINSIARLTGTTFSVLA